MFDVVAFKKEHLEQILNEESNKDLKAWMENGVASNLEKTDSVTILCDENVQAFGGVNPYWPGRGQIWCVFSQKSKANFLPTFRIIQKWVKYQISQNYHRLELSIDYEQKTAKRRAKLLGFKLEVERARKYLPNGGDCTLYSLVRD